MCVRQAVVAAGLALGLMSGAAKANTINVFSASGTFDDSRTLVGMIDVDVTSGNVISTNLSIYNPAIPYSSIISFKNAYDSKAFGGGYVLRISSENSFRNIPHLSLLLAATTLVGYEGGSIYSETFLSPKRYVSGLVSEFGNVGLTSGTLRFLSSYSDGPVSTVPLPASAPMFGVAVLGLAGIGYTAKRKKTATAA